MAEVQKSFLKRLFEQLIQGSHNDVELSLEDGSTAGSKICLTALSDYFETMLKSDILEKNNGVVMLPTISKATFENVLKVYFLGENVVNELNCFPLLDAAEFMHLNYLKSLCVGYLTNNLTVTTEESTYTWRSLNDFRHQDRSTAAFQKLFKSEDRFSESVPMNLKSTINAKLLLLNDSSDEEDRDVRDVQMSTKTKSSPVVPLMKNISQLLIQGNYNNIEINFHDGSTSGSKICLSALSPYFEAMLTSDMTEKTTGVITLPTISSTTFQQILNVYLFGENIVNEVNCYSLLDVSEMFLLDHLKYLCIQFLYNTLTTENCIAIWRVFEKYTSDEFATKVFRYMVENIERLSESGSLLNLTNSEYVELLSRDDLPQKEDDVLRDVQKWISTNKPSAANMISLFKEVRFEYVSLSSLTDDVSLTSIAKQHQTLHELVQKGINGHCRLPGQMNSFVDNRIAGQSMDVMFVLSQQSEKINVLSAICLTDETWHELPPAPTDPGLWFAGAVLGRNIYITGGTGRLQSTLIYDVWNKTWTLGPDLRHGRWSHCMTAVGDKLYVIGGLDTTSIEELQQGHTDWQVVGDLGCKRCDCGAEAVGEHILVMGGNVKNALTDRVLCFNTLTHAVSTVYRLPQRGGLTRSYLDMSNVYLVHKNGDIDVVHVTCNESNSPTLTNKRAVIATTYDLFGNSYVVRKAGFGSYYGFVYKDGSIIIVTQTGSKKISINNHEQLNGCKADISFRNEPIHQSVIGALNMLVPRFCLQG